MVWVIAQSRLPAAEKLWYAIELIVVLFAALALFLMISRWMRRRFQISVRDGTKPRTRSATGPDPWTESAKRLRVDGEDPTPKGDHEP